MELTVLREVHEVVSVATEVDVFKTGGRYQVVLTHDPVRRVYIISAPNYHVSVETSYPQDCVYKLIEYGVSRPDAEAIGYIVNQLLLPKISG